MTKSGGFVIKCAGFDPASGGLPATAIGFDVPPDWVQQGTIGF